MLRELKKGLMNGKGKVYVRNQAQERLFQRGYTKGDIVAALFNGEIIERQSVSKIAILGRDQDDNPIVVVLEKERVNTFSIVTALPPIDRNRFKECV